MAILFGPVPSRRLGRSLGVDMVPYKTCSFNCVYCELGKTTCQVVERQSFLDLDLVCDELKERLASLHGQLDYITLAGSGEPTLNRDLGELVSRINGFTSVPVALLTNSSLISDPLLRKELQEIDLLVPSLDAVTQEVFERINLPLRGIKAREIVDGLIALRQEFHGQIWLEILFCQGINDHDSEVNLLHKAVDLIQPDRVQLNSVFRPPAVEGVLPSTPERLAQIGKIFGPIAQIVGEPHMDKAEVNHSRSFGKRILELLKRRPCTISDLAQASGVSHGELVKLLDDLSRAGLISVRYHEGQGYYAAANG